jgi:hypothetical protein
MNRPMSRIAAAILVGALAVVMVACGSNDEPRVPTGPGVSRAEPTGTVDTTLPATSTTRD